MELQYKPKNIWESVSEKETKKIMDFGDRYMKFLDVSKTERECVTEIEKTALKNGFRNFEKIANNEKIKSGDKIYLKNREKSIVMLVMGQQNISLGMNIVAAHIDVPRLDLKPRPLYEEGNLALLKTHYYGGVKKYQWTAIPLSLHGVVYTQNNEKIEIVIGEDENDPVFYINDLLIHLSADQMQKKLSEGITGEQLNVVIGHAPIKDKSTDKDKDKDKKDPIKEHILSILHDKYNMVEEDFMMAELEIVPAGKARHVGLDKSLIAAHGHDDRSCSYAALEGIINVKKPERTAVAVFVDKEEIGSVGNASMQSKFFENFIAEVINLQGNYSEIFLKRALANSKVLSGDVTVAFDPTFPEVLDQKNAAFLGNGVTVSKYTGARGKSGCNDANAEFLGELRKLFKDNQIIWQTGELGKVDQGGGGTVAYILANYGAEVVDCGVPMLSMHAPVELLSKADIYMTSKAYHSFLK